MAESGDNPGFTVYLEGHKVHRGNVLARAFLAKTHSLLGILAAMERAFIHSGSRRTDYEITAAEKRNPTTLTLSPVSAWKGYDPTPALNWSLTQIATIARGGEPDERIRGQIATDLVKLATKQSEDAYQAFWINGHTDAVRFDEEFLAKALAFVAKPGDDQVSKWRRGAALGSVVGELKAVDDVRDEREFVIVPPTGADAIACRFPASARGEMHLFLFRTVRVEGTLHYSEASPFPYRVDANVNGIVLYPPRERTKSLSQLRGLFAGLERSHFDLLAILDA